MVQEIRAILAKQGNAESKIKAIQELADSTFESQEIIQLLTRSLGMTLPGEWWENMSVAEMKAALEQSPTVPRSEYANIPETDEAKEQWQLVVKHWCRQMKFDNGRHIDTRLPISKRVYVFGRPEQITKPQTLLETLKELGLADKFAVTFTINDGFVAGQQVTIGDGVPAKLIRKPNLFQWWAEIQDGARRVPKLVEVRDIKSL